MWRRYGDDLYALLVLVVFSFEALTLGFLTWGFALSAARALEGGELITILVASVAVTALALITIGSYVIAYHMISTRRERHRRVRLDEWTGRWVAVLFEGRTPPPGPLSSEGVETLLDLREHLTGAEGERVESLVRRYDIGGRLLERTALDAPGRGLVRLLRPLRRRRLSGRLDALESLAKARLAQSVEPLLRLLDDREPAVRLMALRSLARSLARMPEGRRYDRAVLGMAEAVMTSEIPAGAVEEAMLLLEGAAPRVLGMVLAASPADQRAGLVARAIDAVGRLKLLGLAEDVGAHVADPDAEVRAAALRALGRLGILPTNAAAGLADAMGDRVEFVRVQAARTAMLLQPEVATPALWRGLGDESWWVRKAAAHGLLGLGLDGPDLLQRASRTHPDRYARQMALQVLLDAGRLDAHQARVLREAV
ncbi:MAG: HEAT repeat domain-containing protein [Actinomycetota bacterium]